MIATPSRRALIAATALAALTPGRARAESGAEEVWTLWPKGPPGGVPPGLVEVVEERSPDTSAFHDRIARHTTRPQLTVVRPIRPNGASLLLIPGGGYRWSVVDKEGLDCARVFAALGVTCFVLRYRLPGDGWRAGPDAPLQDAQRALRLIRARAAAEGLARDRIAVLGASAGGHLAGRLLSHLTPTYAADDAADAEAFRPDLGLLLYPVVTLHPPFAHLGSRTELLGETPPPERLDAYSLERADWTGAPPVWLVHALDDTAVRPENSLALLTALRAAHTPVEAHLFQEGGHGFGVRLIAGRPAERWPELAMAFGRRHGWGGLSRLRSG